MRIKEYVTADGQVPFSLWLKKLKNIGVRAKVRTRLARVSQGNLGDYKSLGAGLFELRFTTGAGYRVYFGYDGDTIILLLSGGDKSTQSKDIDKARAFLLDYKRRTV